MNTKQRNREQGSMLITAILVTFVLSLISGSYLYMSLNEHRMAKRSFYMGAGFALAEGGVDYAIKALNEGSATGWTVSSDTWSRTLTGFTVSNGATGSMKMKIVGASTATPVVYSEATVSSANMPDVVRQLKVDVDETSSGNSLKNTLLYAKFFSASGNNTMAAMYDSRNGGIGDFYTDEDGNWTFNLDDDLRVLIDTYTASGGSFGNMDVFGWVITQQGGSITFNANGGTFDYGGSDTDPSDGISDGVATADRVTEDSFSSFVSETAPDDANTYTSATSASLSFVQEGSGRNKVDVATWGSQTIRLTGSSAVLSIANKQRLDIDGDVVIVIDNGGSIDIKGELNVTSNGSLKIYTDGDIDVGGSGIANKTNVAENLQIYGTNTTVNAQTFKLHGNTGMTAFVYAPDAIADLKGGGGDGEFVGALVMNQIKMTGNYFFIGDAALSDLLQVPTGSGGFEVAGWTELTNTTTETARHTM